MADVKGTLKLGEKSYTYFETKPTNARGGGPRGIEIYMVGVADSKVAFDINPNPHDNKKYNKKQVSFYLAMAKEIVDKAVEADGVVSFPKKASQSWEGESYTLSR